MKRMVRWVASLTTTLVLAACSPTEPGRNADALTATARAATLRLTNNSDRTAYYFAVERLTATLILWGPCDDPHTCVGLAPGESVSVPYASITGYHAGATEAIVYWWHIVARADGSFTTDSIRSHVLKL